ncbi:MAG: TonB-dependent receptor [Ignavibacteriae bacterium]|nr:TonB-dependent receptor [Ignavibacteriota bacterium]
MKLVLSIILFISTVSFGQNIELKGKVVDVETNEPLMGVNITIRKSEKGTATNENGEFSFTDNYYIGEYLTFSTLGYSKKIFGIEEFLLSDKIVYLSKVVLDLYKTVVVKGIIAEERTTPASFSKIKRKEIEQNYTVQDLPEYLSYLPSTTSYSQSGNGLGYNFLSIRGFGQRRISITVNGIPQNDPEDHNVYWLDMPDLLESTELLQVQRGAGAGIVGYPSIGGSINIITSNFSDKPKFELSASAGSFNTRKYSAKFSSGLINNKYSVYAKLSKMLSDGYRDNSWIDFNSYHVSAVRYDEKLTTQINLFGGPVSDGLAFYGLKKEVIKDRELRKVNNVQPREIENFSQPHFELLNEYKILDNLTLNNAIFYVQGDGFFDYDDSWSIYYDDYFRLKQNGYNSLQVPTNVLIHAEVNNKQFGVLPKLTWEHTNGSFITGIEYRKHRSKHWGGIRFAENIPSGVPQDYQYYYYEGGNDIFNFFVNENYNLTEKLNILGEIQLSSNNYKLFSEKYLGNDISISDLHINPRLGLNYKFNNSLNTYASFARVTRVPRLKNYYDAAESSGGAIPQFERNTDGSYNFDTPLVKPEIMNDIELGARYSETNYSINANLFYMLFNDEIIKKGQLDRFGQPITGNIDETIHAGIEVEGSVKLTDNFDFIFNSSYSKNYISKGSTFLGSGDENVELELTDNKIGGFPELTMNAILRGHYKGLSFQATGKYVGEYFSDNFDDNLETLLLQYPGFVSYEDNKVDAYFVMNFMASFDVQLNTLLTSARVFVQVNNIFDNLYAAHATGGDFFPAAERNFLAGIKFGL